MRSRHLVRSRIVSRLAFGARGARPDSAGTVLECTRWLAGVHAGGRGATGGRRVHTGDVSANVPAGMAVRSSVRRNEDPRLNASGTKMLAVCKSRPHHCIELGQSSPGISSGRPYKCRSRAIAVYSTLTYTPRTRVRGGINQLMCKRTGLAHRQRQGRGRRGGCHYFPFGGTKWRCTCRRQRTRVPTPMPLITCLRIEPAAFTDHSAVSVQLALQ